MTINQINAIREKVNATPNKVYNTRIYQYYLNGSGELCRVKRDKLDTMAMYDADAIEIIR